MQQIQMHAVGKLFTVTRQVAPGAKSAVVDFPVYLFIIVIIVVVVVFCCNYYYYLTPLIMVASCDYCGQVMF